MLVLLTILYTATDTPLFEAVTKLMVPEVPLGTVAIIYPYVESGLLPLDPEKRTVGVTPHIVEVDDGAVPEGFMCQITNISLESMASPISNGPSTGFVPPEVEAYPTNVTFLVS